MRNKVTKIIISKSIEETRKLVKSWFASLNKSKNGATIVGFYGNLGSGKTAFSQAVAKELGIKENVTSPTFVIKKFYDTNHKKFKKLIHIDAYRLNNGKELETLNFKELMSDKDNLILIEWIENVKEIIPSDHIKIYCEFVDETTREFRL